MIEETLQNGRELWREIWDVDEEPEPPKMAKLTSRLADRLANIGVVLIYAVVVAYATVKLIDLIPDQWITQFGNAGRNTWFWVGATFVVVTALRFGLDITKTLKRWRVTSLLGSLLLFDFLMEKAPPLFGISGFSLIDGCFGSTSDSNLVQMLLKACGI